MSMTLAELKAEAMKLSPAEREQLAEAIYTSLDELEELDETWQVEIARRVAEVESGDDVGIPAEQVFAEIRAELEESRARRK